MHCQIHLLNCGYPAHLCCQLIAHSLCLVLIDRRSTHHHKQCVLHCHQSLLESTPWLCHIHSTSSDTEVTSMLKLGDEGYVFLFLVWDFDDHHWLVNQCQ
jgi:hypothetical protein